ncbi:serine/threonine-protein kinase M1 [Knufia fluminis]|uniref:Serine/threonine-protein kinase MEC1 n=1 Tax=Knufia fluminis TaxID=191047 RepID=A0AAN8IRK6_9EURO|nr:serine/threonine-protein kinase M1 [Knufia fluminis]
MARANGISHRRDLQPPPSSMLATHVINGAARPSLSRADFSSLLQESLGTDDEGHSNIGKDVNVNFKLISVIVQIGIDPLISTQENDPFQKRIDQGRSTSELKCCLDVIIFVLQQSPSIIYHDANSAGVAQHDVLPVYAWLLSIILSVVAQSSDVEIQKRCGDVVQGCIDADDKCSCGSCGSVVDLFRETVAAFAKKSSSTSMPAEVRHQTNGADSSAGTVAVSPYCRSVLQRAHIRQPRGYVEAASFMAQALLLRPLPKAVIIQLKKQLKLLENVVRQSPVSEPSEFQLEALKSRIAGLSMTYFPDTDLVDAYDNDDFPDSDRARKRARLSNGRAELEARNDPATAITQTLAEKLTGRAVSDLDSLAKTSSSHFRRSAEHDQCAALTTLGSAACQLASGSLSTDCDLCDRNSAMLGLQSSDKIECLLDTLETLQPHVERGETVRLAALDAYRRVLNHIQLSQRLSLTNGTAGKFALRSLRSTNRDTRLKAAKLLQSFVRDMSCDQSSTSKDNRIAALEYLQSLWQRGGVRSQESVILALASIAEVAGDDELNIILLRLIEYLGHSNPYISALAASELVQLARAMETTVPGLLRPFWRTISVVVVKNMTSRPVVAQQLCDLCGMHLAGLLQVIEENALPYLVLHGEKDLIHKIASSSSSPMNAFEVCVKPSNLPKILATLLAQGYADPEDTIMRMLMQVSNDFREQDLSGWLGLNLSSVACEILKAIKDAGHSKESRVLQGLQVLAQLAYRKPSSGSAGRRSDLIPSFLETNSLEIVTLITSKFDDTKARELNVERRRCLHALAQVVKLGKNRVNMVIPQICACLRAAMSDHDLCNAAYLAWSTTIACLGEDELIDLLEQTFAITVQYWPNLYTETQQTAHDTISQLFKKQRTAVRERIEMLPSLRSVPQLAQLEEELAVMRQQKDELNVLSTYVTRLKDETLVVVQLAMVELAEVLRNKNDFIQRSVTREQPDIVIAELIRVILDCSVKFNKDEQILLHAAQCLGAIGKVDTSRIDSSREQASMIVLSDFAIAAETTAFLLFFMDNVVVKEYVSASSLRSKTFLGWALQELLKISGMTPEVGSRTRVGGLSGKDRQWLELPEETRLVLTPFLASKFIAPGRKPEDSCTYPVFRPGLTFEQWLTRLALDLLSKGPSQNVDIVFTVFWRMVHFSPGTAISSFLLPYAALNLLLNGTNTEKEELSQEILCILQQPYDNIEASVQETIRQCSQAVFGVVDYLSKWLQDKRRWFSNAQSRAERGLRDPGLDTAVPQIEAVDSLLKSIPPEVVTQRSIECKSYARALLHWDEYIHNKKNPTDDDYRRLQNIYAQIDEPDGIEGISSCMHVLNSESQILEHRNARRWQAVQNWYEMQMTEQPNSVDIQVNLLNALRQSGQHDVLLHHFGGIAERATDIDHRLLPFATEAAWATAQFDALSRLVDGTETDHFNLCVGSNLLQLQSGIDLEELWLTSAKDFSYSSTSSISASTDTILTMHVTEDLRLMTSSTADTKGTLLDVLNRRLAVLGTDVAAKHFVLNVQRAVMHLRKDIFDNSDIASSWLTTAKLARKARVLNQALDAVLRAASLGDQSVAIEQAKLMWLEGRHRKAIKTLESAIESGAFKAHTYIADKDSMLSRSDNQEQNNMIAKAYVLLGKWLDQAGQTQSEVIIKTFRKSTEQNKLWESGWYHLGRHYNRILESERQKPPGKESQPFLIGEAAKTVIDNFLRALACGNKYLFQTLPKMLTLWLELVSNPDVEQDSRRGTGKFHEHLVAQRKKVIVETNAYVKKYVERLQPVALYTILPQLVARICHANSQVYEILQGMIAKVVQSFPQQALWTLMAVTKSVDKTRAQRGLTVIAKIVELQKRYNKGISPTELRTMISGAQRFTDELLRVADYHIEGKIPKISLARDLGFNHKIAPSKLVVPAETCLIPNIPTSNDNATMKSFRAFSKDPVTITAFLDEALVLASLQKPRKMSIRGSDGHVYAILAKPKDDLRKDQRLMEFDTMINRFLKRDIEAAKRRMYIRTYAVIPLNEECGLIEWVNSLKTMRDVLLKLYRERNVVVDYAVLRHTLDDICTRSKNPAKDFGERVVPSFPSVLRYWFVETFPDPSAWLQARIRYTRSAAVMSMVGHILGLGDRHGENILFEEDNGGIMHVDFNCLFDKGLTFDKPEMVPFRMTHNMVDAFGTFGVEGPFRKCCEITMTLLRNHEDGLMTILETFLHDPTTDFMTAGKRRRARDTDGLVPDTAEKMLEGVKGKVRGMLVGESVPLSVGGYVEEMIRLACDRGNLARMYIGWCAFL